MPKVYDSPPHRRAVAPTAETLARLYSTWGISARHETYATWTRILVAEDPLKRPSTGILQRVIGCYSSTDPQIIYNDAQSQYYNLVCDQVSTGNRMRMTLAYVHPYRQSPFLFRLPTRRISTYWRRNQTRMTVRRRRTSCLRILRAFKNAWQC